MRLQSVTIDCAILDSQLDVFEGRKERIKHEVVSVPEENVED